MSLSNENKTSSNCSKLAADVLGMGCGGLAVRVLAESLESVRQCHTRKLRQKHADLKLHVVIGKEPAVWFRDGFSSSLNIIQVLSLLQQHSASPGAGWALHRQVLRLRVSVREACLCSLAFDVSLERVSWVLEVIFFLSQSYSTL